MPELVWKVAVSTFRVVLGFCYFGQRAPTLGISLLLCWGKNLLGNFPRGDTDPPWGWCQAGPACRAAVPASYRCRSGCPVRAVCIAGSGAFGGWFSCAGLGLAMSSSLVADSHHVGWLRCPVIGFSSPFIVFEVCSANHPVVVYG